VLSGRGMDAVLREIRSTQEAMAAGEVTAIDRYGRLEDRLAALGGYGAEAEAASIAANLGLPAALLDRPLRSLSGGQRRRAELARILFGGARTPRLAEPTTHLCPASGPWLGGLRR